MIQVKKLLSPKEVEDLFGIKESTLAQWRWLRTGPDFFRLGRMIKYKTEEIEKFLEENRYHCRRK